MSTATTARGFWPFVLHGLDRCCGIAMVGRCASYDTPFVSTKQILVIHRTKASTLFVGKDYRIDPSGLFHAAIANNINGSTGI